MKRWAGRRARTRSPAARGTPPADGACAVSAAAAPRHRQRGTGERRPLRAAVCSGSWGSSCGPLPSRLGGRAPSESPARRRRSRAARTSRLRRGRRPRAPLPPALVSVWRRSPQARRLVRPSASRHSGAPLSRRGPGSPRLPGLLSLFSASSLRFPEPPGPSSSLPLPVPTRRAAGTGSRSLFLPWSPALCAGCPQPAPSGTSVSTTLHLGLLLGCKDPKVSEVRESPLVGVGPRRRSPSLRLVLGYPSPEDHRGWPEELWTGTRAGGQEKVAKESG